MSQPCNNSLEIQVSHPEYEHTLNALQNLFSLQGNLKKLVLLKENQDQKITVEYNNQEDAKKAFDKLNGSQHEGIGKLSLTYLALNGDSKENQHLTLKQLAEQNPIKKFHFADISNQISSFQSPNPKKHQVDPLLRIKEGIRNKSQSFHGSPQKQVLLEKGSKFVNRQSVKTQQQANPFVSKMKPSKVVLISNLEDIFERAQEVFNLFSCFGNVRKVLLMKNLQKAMVEYYETDSSLLCAVNVNNLKLLNTELRINYSKHPTIDLEKNNKNPNSISFNEIFIPSAEEHRYKRNDFVGNIGSNIKVHISYESPLNVQEVQEEIRDLLQGKEVSLMQENRKEKYVQLRVGYEKVQDAVMAIIKHHKREFREKVLDLSFCF